MYEVATREIPDRSLLCLKRNVDEEGAWALGKEFIAILRERPLPKMNGREGAMFSIYWSEVSADSDGPVEWCKPVPEETAKALASHYPELTLRTEPAHSEAYVALPNDALPGGPGGNPGAQWQLASEALQAWAVEHGIDPVSLALKPEDLGVRITYLASEPVTETSPPTATSPCRSREQPDAALDGAKARRLVHDHFEHEGAIGRGASHLADDLADAGRRAAGIDEHLHRRRARRSSRGPTATIPPRSRSIDSRSSLRLCARRSATAQRWWASASRSDCSGRSGTVWIPTVRLERDVTLPPDGERASVAVEHLREAISIHDGDHLVEIERFDEASEARVDEACA